MSNKTWYFEWNGEGYNSVNAPSKVEAIKAATELGKSPDGKRVTLVPNESTLTADAKEIEAIEKRWAGLFD